MIYTQRDVDSACETLKSYLFSSTIPEEKSRQIAVYGAGNTANLYITGNSFTEEGIHPTYFIDNSPSYCEGSCFMDIPVINFEQSHTLCKDFMILICAAGDASTSIVEALQREPISGTSVFMLDEYVFCKRREEILSVFDMLEDSISKLTYANMILCRMGKEEQNLDLLSSNQYFSIPQFLKRRKDEIFVDCGATMLALVLTPIRCS